MRHRLGLRRAIATTGAARRFGAAAGRGSCACSHATEPQQPGAGLGGAGAATEPSDATILQHRRSRWKEASRPVDIARRMSFFILELCDTSAVCSTSKLEGLEQASKYVEQAEYISALVRCSQISVDDDCA